MLDSVIHGLPESKNTLPGLSRKDDFDGVKTILTQIQPSDYADLRLHRLGKPKGSSSRPLCVGLKSPEAVRNILINKSRYSEPCKIIDDKTPIQRQALD